MKKILISIVIAAGFGACKKSNNTPPIVPPAPAVDRLMLWTKSAKLFYSIEDVWFTSLGTGFLVVNPAGPSSAIYTSADLGASWTVIPNTASTNVFNLQFLNDQVGVAQGLSNIQFTSDGGKTWIIKNLPSSSALYSQFVSVQTGFYADVNGGIYKTVDGGSTWNLDLGYQIQNQRSPFYFIDSLQGFTMADGNFGKTTDGGINWHVVTAGVDAPVSAGAFFKMQMLDTLTGFCGTSQGVLKTVDGGQTWTNTFVSSSKLSILQFFDRVNGYATIDGSIFKTTDGGQTWSLSCKLAADSFSGIHFLDMDHGWACTFGGYVLTLN